MTSCEDVLVPDYDSDRQVVYYICMRDKDIQFRFNKPISEMSHTEWAALGSPATPNFRGIVDVHIVHIPEQFTISGDARIFWFLKMKAREFSQTECNNEGFGFRIFDVYELLENEQA